MKNITMHFSYKPAAFILVFIALIISPFSTVHAQTAEEFGVIINLSGKQRMLTQKMSKEAVLVALNIDKQQNLKNLESTSALFDKTLKGLRNGDTSLKLPATSSPRILRNLDRVEKLWADYYPIVQDIVANKAVTKAQIAEIAERNLPLLKQMNKTVGAYEKEAAASGLKASPGLATTINLSGKQRMLTQKMSKEFLLIAYNHEVADNKINLLETFTLFERTLQGLKVGDDTLGLPPTSDLKILSQLDQVSKLWNDVKPLFVGATSNNTKINDDQLNKLASLNIPLLQEMNKAVGMYEQLAK